MPVRVILECGSDFNSEVAVLPARNVVDRAIISKVGYHVGSCFVQFSRREYNSFDGSEYKLSMSLCCAI